MNALLPVREGTNPVVKVRTCEPESKLLESTIEALFKEFRLQCLQFMLCTASQLSKLPFSIDFLRP